MTIAETNVRTWLDTRMMGGFDYLGVNDVISNLPFFTAPRQYAGQYRISWDAVITVADPTSATLGGVNGFQVTYTDDETNAVVTTAPAQAGDPMQTNADDLVGSAVSGSVLVNCAPEIPLTLSFDYLSANANSMVYNLKVRVEYIG